MNCLSLVYTENIFGFLSRNLWQSSEIFGNHRKRSKDLRTTIRQFLNRFCFHLNEIYCYSEFFTGSVQMPKRM